MILSRSQVATKTHRELMCTFIIIASAHYNLFFSLFLFFNLVNNCNSTCTSNHDFENSKWSGKIMYTRRNFVHCNYLLRLGHCDSWQDNAYTNHFGWQLKCFGYSLSKIRSLHTILLHLYPSNLTPSPISLCIHIWYYNPRKAHLHAKTLLFRSLWYDIWIYHLDDRKGPAFF